MLHGATNLTLIRRLTPLPLSSSEILLQKAALRAATSEVPASEAALRSAVAREFAARAAGVDTAPYTSDVKTALAAAPPGVAVNSVIRQGLIGDFPGVPRDLAPPVLWLCRCFCGAELEVPEDRLRQAQRLIHGPLGHYLPESTPDLRRAHPNEHTIWRMIWQRCRVRGSSKVFALYGARGIDLDERWSRFENFMEDMGPRPSRQHSVEREDVNGHYTKSNCKWATYIEQARNKREKMITVEYQGQTQLLADLIRTGVCSHTTVRNRLGKGWDIEKALTTPVQKPHRKHRRKKLKRRREAPVIRFKRMPGALPAPMQRVLRLLSGGAPAWSQFRSQYFRVGRSRDHVRLHLLEQLQLQGFVTIEEGVFRITEAGREKVESILPRVVGQFECGGSRPEGS